MKARSLIADADLDLKTRSVALNAFDTAWAEIAQHFGNIPADIESGRVRLARMLLAAITNRADLMSRGAAGWIWTLINLLFSASSK